MARLTILDAVVAVLPGDGAALSAREIRDRIVERALFHFQSEDSLGMVRAAIRRHLRNRADADRRVAIAGPDRFASPPSLEK